jgi:hypothetical protein
VGFGLALIVLAAVFIGAWLQYIDRRDTDPSILPMPANLLIGAAFGCGCVMLGATVVLADLVWAGQRLPAETRGHGAVGLATVAVEPRVRPGPGCAAPVTDLSVPVAA